MLHCLVQRNCYSIIDNLSIFIFSFSKHREFDYFHKVIPGRYCIALRKQNLFFFVGSALQGELHVDFHDEPQESSPTENGVRLRVVLESFQTMMAASVSELRRAGLVLDTCKVNRRQHYPRSAAETTILSSYSPVQRYTNCDEKAAVCCLSRRGVQTGGQIAVHVPVSVYHENVPPQPNGKRSVQRSSGPAYSTCSVYTKRARKLFHTPN